MLHFMIKTINFKSKNSMSIVPHVLTHLSDICEGYKGCNMLRGSDGEEREYNQYMSVNDQIIGNLILKPDQHPNFHSFIRAGPYPSLHFNPCEVNAAIVTCGGLCPGQSLNFY